MLGNVPQACQVMGYSRDSFYRFQQLYDQGGTSALQEISRARPNIWNRAEQAVEEAVLELAIGHLRASNDLKKQGNFISSVSAGL
jgi:hypothetical protein